MTLRDSSKTSLLDKPREMCYFCHARVCWPTQPRPCSTKSGGLKESGAPDGSDRHLRLFGIMIGRVFREAGLTQADTDHLSGRDLGIVVAQAMMVLSKRIQFPTRLSEVPGFSDVHIQRALTAARDPQLRMKLENMPVPLTAEMVDEYMRPVLEAAKDGDLSRINNVA